MRKNPQLEAVLEELHEAGITPQVSNGRKHIRVCWEGADGQARQCVIAGTPGDRRRGAANARATVRRLLRREGSRCQLQ